MTAAGESVEDSAELVEGGYLAALGVYHEIHCLVSISNLFRSLSLKLTVAEAVQALFI